MFGKMGEKWCKAVVGFHSTTPYLFGLSCAAASQTGSPGIPLWVHMSW